MASDKTTHQPEEDIFRPKYGRDRERDLQRKRIFDEIIVDCYKHSEFQKAWYRYLNNNIFGPFEADVFVRINNSGEYKMKTIDILALADEVYCTHDMFVKAETWGEYDYFYVSLVALQNIQGSESTKQAIGDWQYWRSDYF